MINLNYTNFKKEVIDSDVPVVVGCYMTGDASESMMLLMKAVSMKYDKKVKVAKLDANEHSQLAEQYGVRKDQTFLLFHDGKPVDKIIGGLPKSMFELQMEMMMEKLLSRMMKKNKG